MNFARCWLNSPKSGMPANDLAIGATELSGKKSRRPWSVEFQPVQFKSITMTTDQIARANTDLRQKPALEIIRWALAQAHGRAVVSTNFRPYEAVVLHLCAQAQPDIPVLWVDHGYNRP